MLDEDHPYRHPWLGLGVRHLAALVAVGRAGSFRQAALELGYGPSAVARRIAGLESVVGARPVERGRGQRSVALTPAGLLLLERSVGIIGQLRAARLDVLAREDVGATVIRLAIDSDTAPLLEPLVARATRQLPGVRCASWRRPMTPSSSGTSSGAPPT